MDISPDLAVSSERNAQSPMSEAWYVENIRFTFLGVTDWTQRQIFSEIAGVTPTQINVQPAAQLHQETGNLSDAYLTVSQQADRIDVILSDLPTRNTVDPALPDYKPLYSIGPFHMSIKTFDSISERAVALIPGATRIAYAITLIHQTETVREAVVWLQTYLPTVDFDSAKDLDPIFQINRPIRDKEGRFINRLARWDTIQVTSVRVTVGANLPVRPLPTRPPVCAARAYIDISTDVDNTSVFTSPELSELLGELRAYAIHIAERGDSK